MSHSEMEDVIIRNRKVLGLCVDKLMIDTLIWGNDLISLNVLGKEEHESNVILADGLIVGYEIINFTWPGVDI